MNLTNAQLERLAILNEECAEVQHLISKTIRHGLSSFNPDGDSTSNQSLLAIEVAHLLYVIGFVVSEGDISEKVVSIHTVNRQHTFGKYLHYNKTPLDNYIRKLICHKDFTTGLMACDKTPEQIVEAIDNLPVTEGISTKDAIKKYLEDLMFEL